MRENQGISQCVSQCPLGWVKDYQGSGKLLCKMCACLTTRIEIQGSGKIGKDKLRKWKSACTRIFQGSFPNVELPSLMFLTSENPVLEGPRLLIKKLKCTGGVTQTCSGFDTLFATPYHQLAKHRKTCSEVKKKGVASWSPLIHEQPFNCALEADVCELQTGCRLYQICVCCLSSAQAVTFAFW